MRHITYSPRSIVKLLKWLLLRMKHCPVQSVWICVYDIPENMQNRHLHFEYSTYDESGLPEFDIIFPGQDLARIDFILLSENYDWDINDDNVIKFLQSIFHNNMNDGNFN